MSTNKMSTTGHIGYIKISSINIYTFPKAINILVRYTTKDIDIISYKPPYSNIVLYVIQTGPDFIILCSAFSN